MSRREFGFRVLNNWTKAQTVLDAGGLIRFGDQLEHIASLAQTVAGCLGPFLVVKEPPAMPLMDDRKGLETMTKKLQVVFDSKALEVLERLRASTNATSGAEVIRDALSFYNWARLQVEDGKTLAVVDEKNNKVREFILPFALLAK